VDAVIDWLIDFPTQHPTLTSWFTSIVSGSVVIKFFWSYWKRPIIWVRLHEKYQSVADVPFQDRGGRVYASTYQRLSIKNRGRTTLKDCFATITGVTVRETGKDEDSFETDPRSCGWSNEPPAKRDLHPKRAHTVDIATLLKGQSGSPSQLYWDPTTPPATFYNFVNPLSVAPGETRYIFRVDVDAGNARARTVPVEFLFDPTRPEFRFVPFSTRWPGWRLRRWLRAKLGFY
jgi:hypothetical protein